MFYCGVTHNLTRHARRPGAWQAYGKMPAAVESIGGVNVPGIIDDDRLAVGDAGNASNSPWTLYITADVRDFDTAVVVCNLYRTAPVGEYNLWRHGTIEARAGRTFQVPSQHVDVVYS
ncbi:hypothetical protein SB778_30890 [Paraburkholderia sp. SIMBA_050]